jgi:aldehyde dehydrogenase (NAD+)
MGDSALSAVLENQRRFFNTGKTKDLNFRIGQLRLLERLLNANEDAICDALKRDMNKSRFEAYVGEIGMVANEITYAARRVRSWAKPQRVRTPLIHFPASSRIHSEPLGVVLIIGPWNYPIQLVLSPLVGAMAAGNCAMLKPSRHAPHTAKIIAELIGQNFAPDYVSVAAGAADSSQLLEERFDYIFFTGGAAVGKIVAAAAAKHLTPATLELGGKSPCIVDRDARLDVAARRITWGKFFNAGQTCVAPDYLLVDRVVKDPLLERIKASVTEFYGDDPRTSPDYARIINQRHFERLIGMLDQGDIVIGGERDPSDNYLAPTVIDHVSLDHKIMEDEIFGPILPVISYADLDEGISIVNRAPKPLSLYFFSESHAKLEKVIRETTSGGATMNDTVLHLSTQTLPFGGVGQSGYGKYHGKASFDTFSNKRSILHRSFALDLPLRYPPYGNKLSLVKRLLRLIG